MRKLWILASSIFRCSSTIPGVCPQVSRRTLKMRVGLTTTTQRWRPGLLPKVALPTKHGVEFRGWQCRTARCPFPDRFDGDFVDGQPVFDKAAGVGGC